MSLKIKHINDVQKPLFELFEKGNRPGHYLGFPNLSKFYNMRLGNTTYWTGSPTSGKSTLLFEFLINTAQFYGWKHLIYSPEMGSAHEIHAELIHMITGMTFDKRYPNRISEQEIYKAIPFIQEYFLIADNEGEESVSPYDFYKFTKSVHIEHGIQTATIDPWNELEHDLSKFGGKVDKYLESTLTKANRLAKQLHIHLNIAAHPTKLQKDKNGEYPPATAYDISGGGAWYAKGQNIISAYRPTGDGNMVEVYIQKVKPKIVGSKGMTNLYFDIEKARYYEQVYTTKYYANKLKADEPIKTTDKLKEHESIPTNPNDPF